MRLRHEEFALVSAYILNTSNEKKPADGLGSSKIEPPKLVSDSRARALVYGPHPRRHTKAPETRDVIL